MADFQPHFLDFESDTFIDDISGALHPDRIPPSMLEVAPSGQSDGSNVANGSDAFSMPNYAFSDQMGMMTLDSGYNDYNLRTLVSTGLQASPMSNPDLLLANTLPGGALVKDSYLSPEYSQDLVAPPPKLKALKVVKPKKDKSSHNMIEKKYRTNINLKIVALRDAVPSLRIAAGLKDITVADLEGLTPALKLNKALVLTKATEYIKHLENKNLVLKQQNAELQRLIQEANLRPPATAPVPPHGAGVAHGFGFYPDAPLQYAAPVVSQPEYAPPQMQPPHHQGFQFNPMANKMLMAGMATMVGQQMFAGGNDNYQGMAAAPFLLMFTKLPQAALFSVIKLLLVAAAVYLLAAPLLANKSKPSKDDVSNDFEFLDVALFKRWLLVHIGVKLPSKLSPFTIKQIHGLLNGQLQLSEGETYQQLFRYFFMLSVAETSFENCLLLLVIGRLLIYRYPMLKLILNTSLTLKGQMMLHLEYRGDNADLHRLAILVYSIDGLGVVGLELMMSRLTNLLLRRPINTGITKGFNHIKFIEMHSAAKGDYFAVIANWRILEVIHALNEKFLEHLTKIDESDELLKDILADVESLEPLLAGLKLQGYFDMFKAVVNPATAPQYAEIVHERVQKQLQVFKQVVDGPELTDDELWSDDEEVIESIAKPQPSLLNNKLLITLLGLVQLEEFISMVLLFVVYHVKNDETDQALHLINYLKIDKVSELTLLLFTAMILMLVEVIPTLDDIEVLDDTVKLTREWVNLGLLDSKLQLGLSKVIVAKGKVLNGVEMDTDGE